MQRQICVSETLHKYIKYKARKNGLKINEYIRNLIKMDVGNEINNEKNDGRNNSRKE